MASVSSSIAQDDGGALPDFEALVQHLLAARRSLGCVEHVSRANSLVTSTRQVLERHTIQRARTGFLHAGSIAQIQVLEQIQRHAQSSFQESIDEFNKIAQSFQQVDARLKTTLDKLCATKVERSMRPPEEEPKSLVDFVDETGVQRVRGEYQESVNVFVEARLDYEKGLSEFNEDVAEARELLASNGTEQADGTGSLQESRDYPLTYVLERLETLAHDMASNLESLVKHFDLCITAIRHAEGDSSSGGARISQITNELPEALREQLEQSATLEPIDATEHQEMLEVLTKDSGEVDDVVSEIKATLSEMETEHEQVDQYAAQISERTEQATLAIRLLNDIGHKLPQYVTQSQLFQIRWEETKSRIHDLTSDFAGLCDFYTEFLGAYNSLIIEVGRRKDTEKRIAKVRADAMGKINKLLVEEESERSQFCQAQGDFLPVDIWPGLMSAPTRWRFVTEENSDDKLPDISASTITRAIRGLEAPERSASSKESAGGSSGRS